MSVEPAFLTLTPEGIRFCPLCGARLERRPVGLEKRLERVCSGCGFVYFLGQKVVACTIAMDADRILLARRAINPAHGKWTFPGGYVDWGEPVDRAAMRAQRLESYSLPDYLPKRNRANGYGFDPVPSNPGRPNQGWNFIFTFGQFAR